MKHVSGLGGDGHLLDARGEGPREDENQEGNGLCSYSKPVKQRCGFSRGAKALEVAYSPAHETS
jgi:hypothetical protein